MVQMMMNPHLNNKEDQMKESTNINLIMNLTNKMNMMNKLLLKMKKKKNSKKKDIQIKPKPKENQLNGFLNLELLDISKFTLKDS